MRRWCIRLIAAVLVLAASPWPGDAAAHKERLVVGEQKTFKPGYAVGDIAIANPQVCDFRVVTGRREVLLVANGTGFTTLTLWDQRGVKRDEVAIEVVTREYAKLMDDLAQLLHPYPNVTIKTLGARIVLSGTVPAQSDLDTIKELASADSNIMCVVTVGGPSAGRASGDAGAPLQPLQTPAQGGTVVRQPDPPPPARRPTGSTPAAVPLQPQTVPTKPVPVSSPGSERPDAVPVTSAPPRARTVSAPPAVPAPQPAPADTDWSTPRGSGSIEYLVEVYESPSSAPPPDVVGPQGKRLFTAKLRTSPGREVRQFVTVGKASSDPSQVRGLSVGLKPTSVSDGEIVTALVFDTNLPLGPYDQKKPVWLRSVVEIATASGQPRFVTENELAAGATPTGAAPPAPGGSGKGAAVAGAAAGVAVGAASSQIPGGAYIPSFGGLFGGGGGGQPKARPTALLVVITPSVVGGRMP